MQRQRAGVDDDPFIVLTETKFRSFKDERKWGKKYFEDLA
jgi:hypothetical protein